MKDYINQHRMERDRLLGLQYIKRQGVEEAIRQLDNNLIKVVSGPRRAGKSVFALEMLKGSNFAYVNFDDEALARVLRPGNYDNLPPVLDEVYPGNKYWLLDEVQNLPSWEVWLNKLQRRGRNLVVTGSNANLLGRELATSLTGRTTEMTVLPFSFGEYLEARPAGTVGEYLRTGGFPEVITKDLDKINYVSGLVEAVLSKDVVRRHNINRSQLLSDVNSYLLSQLGCEVTYSKMARIFGLSSANTIQKYVGYLQEPYLYFLLERYSFKPKKRIIAPKKLYLADTGFAPLGFSGDTGRLLENAVFLQLVRLGLRPGRELFYYKTRNEKEVDFVVRRGLEVVKLIQVCADMADPKTAKREQSALDEAAEELGCKEGEIVTLESASEWLRRVGDG